MQWTMGKKLYAGIVLLGVVVLATMIAAMYSQRQLRDSVEELAAKTAPNIQRAEHLKFLTEAYRSANQFTVILATGKSAPELEATRSKMEGIGAEFTKVARELEQSDGVDEVRSLTRDADAAMKAFQAKCLDVYRLAAAFKAPEAAAMIAESKPLGDKVQDLTAKIADLEVARLEVASADATRADQIGTTMMVTFTVISLLALGVVGYVVWIIVKTLTAMVNRLKSGSEQVTSAATQVAASAQTLSQGSTEQASSLEQTSASMEEMASMTRKNAESSQEAARLMAEVDRVVEGSNRSLVDMTRSMVSIRESSDKVSKIIKTIDEIAFQTNILALNAAVEAARAGEAGMGFAVVADEVRNLAQRSAQAAKDTAVLIEESIANSQEGNTKVEQVAESIAAITDSVGKVKGLVGEVSESSRQQSQGIDQVAQAVAQMERVTQSTAASAEEGAAASEELNAQAETAMAEIRRLEIMVVGGWADGSAADASTQAVGGGPVNRASRLLKLPSKGSASRPPVPSAEDQIPMGDTGTYGRF